jgi:DNA/RNA endonuclease G (NUC1)
MRLPSIRIAAALLATLGFLSCADAPTAPELNPTRLFTRQAASSHHPAVVISQVYGGGGNAGATYTHDFVELFNPGTYPVSVAGWSVQYASATGTAWQVTALSGTIPAGGYFLVQQAAGAGGTTPLPTPDVIGSIAMAAGAGKVALVNSTTALSGACAEDASIVGRVSFGTTANCPPTTPTLNNTTAALRNDNGCAFTGDVSVDFSTGAPNPRNTASPTITCAGGGDVAVPATVTVEPATADVLVGATLSLTATARDADDNTVATEITWTSSDAAIASVNASGVVTGVAAGTVTITATSANEISGTASITVVDAPPPPVGADVVISQIYGGGGNAGALYTNDFIELFNRGDAAVDLTGWTVQYASAAGTSWQVTALAGSIEPGRYYLVQQAAGAGGTAPLPTPDAVGGINMAAGAGKVLLTSTPGAQTGACPTEADVVDRVGFGTNTTANGCADVWGGRTAQLSNTTAAFRGNDGCVNTGNAAADFSVAAAAPRNSASPIKSCTQPPRVDSDATIQINELHADPVNAENASWGQWFEVHNYGTTPIDMQGWTIISAGTNQPNHVINQSLVVPAGGYAVLGRGADPLRNGGIEIDYNYFTGSSSTIFLDPSDFLMLVDGADARVDSVAWTSLPRGIAKGLRPGLGPRANVDGSDWAFATSTFGDGDYGTPGAENAPLSDTPPFVSPNRITFSGRVATDAPLPVGFESQLFATLLDGSGANITSSTSFTWTSLTPEIATVDERGVIRSVSEGTARFRATAADNTTRVHALQMINAVAGAVTYGDHTEFGVPVDADASDDFLVQRNEFTSSWNGPRGIPNWVAYNLTGSHIAPGQDRCNCFTFDPILESAGFSRYNTADYTGAGAFAGYGIDRGHLARSFDRTSGSLDNARSFYFSNIFPQAADNNQGPWSVHEQYLGGLAQNQNKELWIHAGASGSIGTVKGEGRITIPAWTWKVSVIANRGTRLEDVRDYRDLEVIAVVMPNVPGIRNANWQTEYVVTVDSVESLSGYRFLSRLPANIQRALKTGTQPPIAVVGSPVSGVEGQPIGFDASASVDPNGSIVSYAWAFGDGATGSGATPSHTYAAFGDYTARVVLTDNDGLVDTAYVAVSVAQVTTEQGIAALRAAVEALIAGGTLNKGQATSLNAKIDAAEAAIARGNYPAAQGQLAALGNEISALQRSGRLTAAQAASFRADLERLARATAS